MNSEFKFEPIQKNSIVVDLTKSLLQYIFSGSIKPGEKLPTERQLQEALGVGRSAIREAIKVLAVLGVLEIKHGNGTYLKKPDAGLLIESIEWGILLGEKRVRDIIEARQEIELSIVKLAAQRCTEEELNELWSILEQLKVSTIDDFVEIDIAFHLKLAEMAKNASLKGILTSLQSLLRTWIRFVIESAGETTFSYNDHLKVYQAVANKDPKAAVKAMEEHMQDATKRLLEVVEKQNSKIFNSD
ncbi:GntR family transcriptional repressor for pyruvate dehydrogenase complex [Evansella vedderi]|uniref:GntR family transcriptional repressor for pyruvate dehydrogenase complex n=1 Tax=Evansella vedderi TaxID=38282 RepID=A0ABU0A2V9_9BACI|nr:FadR/GntR family transcriptional regulator [Evansella vedderi]MDQ0257337.1 GntR family transcriptional repressor for pyruvate dehydrogenase complex [Evansella vedderi]